MAEMIMTRKDVLAEAMQFEGTQRCVDAIQEWINNYNPAVQLSWNGNDAQMSGDIKIQAEPGLLVLCSLEREIFFMEASPGDWIVKSSRDTFYTVAKDDFHEIWEVMH